MALLREGHLNGRLVKERTSGERIGKKKVATA
jgi:hypothetical protein